VRVRVRVRLSTALDLLWQWRCGDAVGLTLARLRRQGVHG
jgi:hypothetical protein